MVIVCDLGRSCVVWSLLCFAVALFVLRVVCLIVLRLSWLIVLWCITFVVLYLYYLICWLLNYVVLLVLAYCFVRLFVYLLFVCFRGCCLIGEGIAALVFWGSCVSVLFVFVFYVGYLFY